MGSMWNLVHGAFIFEQHCADDALKTDNLNHTLSLLKLILSYSKENVNSMKETEAGGEVTFCPPIEQYIYNRNPTHLMRFCYDK